MKLKVNLEEETDQHLLISAKNDADACETLYVRYHGRIDDQFAAGLQRPQATSHDLVDAIEAILAARVWRDPARRYPAV